MGGPGDRDWSHGWVFPFPCDIDAAAVLILGCGWTGEVGRLALREGRGSASSPDWQEQTIERLVDWLQERGMVAPAVLFLELGRPLLPIGSQLLLLAQPMLDAMVPALGQSTTGGMLAEIADLLENPLAVDQVLVCLEARSAE